MVARCVRQAVALVAVLSVVGVVPAGAQTPTGDSVLADFVGSDGFIVVRIEARSGPGGEQPVGTVRWFNVEGPIDQNWEGTVTCLAASGNTATVGFSGTYFPVGFFSTAPIAGLIRVFDSGPAGPNQDTFEWAQVQGPADGAPIPGPTDCRSNPSTFSPTLTGTGVPLVITNVGVTGDLIVTDAQPPRPTTKNQCKNGGWKTYGVFKNQGDCVSFVVHQAVKACVFERAGMGRRAFAMLRCIHQRAGG
jgi:hypothetical protein